MRGLPVLFLLGSVAMACSHEQPPPASSATVAAATDTPSRSTQPVKTDVMRAAEADDGPQRTRANGANANANANTDSNGNTNATTTTEARSMVASQPSPPSPSSQPAQPDNTRVNERDRNGNTLTPIDQGNSEADRRMTQQIRQALMNTNGLSFNAKNIKIITLNGKVTLRGTVNSEQERNTVDAAARKIAGTDQIDDLVEVKK